MNKVSVILPTKDRPQQLSNCLDSIEAQTNNLYELVIIDSSKNPIKKLTDKYKRNINIKYHYLKELGFPVAYNFGIQKARGSHFAFLNDDCTIPANWYKSIEKVIKKSPNIAVQYQVKSNISDNIYSDIMNRHYQNWVKSHQIGNSKLDAIDIKCSVIPRKYFYSKNKFNGLNPLLVHGSEDIEIGQRWINQKKDIIFTTKIHQYHHERSNLSDFVSQHYRIATSEGHVQRDTEGNIPLFPITKTFLNIRSFASQEIQYIKLGKIIYFLYLPVLYILLFIIRIIGYSKWVPLKK